MFNILSNIKGALQTGVEKVTKTIQNQIGDLLEEQKQLAEAEELDQQRKKEAKLPWEGIRYTNSKVNGSITDILRDEILELSKNESIFFTKEEDYLYDFKFNIEENKYNAMKIQEYDGNLAEMRRKLVPKKVSDEMFWKNYFYHVEIVKMKYSVTNSVMTQSNGFENDDSTLTSDGFQNSTNTQTMLSFESRQMLRELLLEIAVHEQQIEILRQALAEIPDFEPYAAFRRIDRSRRGSVTAADIHEFLKQNGIKNTEEECELFINHYDRDNDGRLQFTEFLVSILPLDNPKLRTMSTQRKVYDIGYDEFLSPEIEHAMATLFTREIAYQMESDYQKVELANQHDFSLPEAFSSIDVDGTGFIAYTNLKTFFKSQGKAVSDYDIVAVLRRLDRDEDGKISFEEFAFGIKSQGSGFTRTMKSGSRTKAGLGATSPRKGMRLSAKASPKKSTQLPTTINPPTLISTLVAKSPAKQKKTEALASTERSMKSTGNISQKAKSTLKSTKAGSLKLTGEDFNKKIILYLKEIINLEREIELSKQDLALQTDFNLLDAFKIFDSKNQGQLSISDIERGCTQLAINPSKEDLILFMERFDKDNDAKLSFAEFIDVFAPLQPEYYNELKIREPVGDKPCITPSQVFTPHTRKLIKSVLIQHIQNEISAEGIRQTLNAEGAFHLTDAFAFFDKNKCGFITIDQLRCAFENFKVFATDKELYYLINRFDRSRQNKITLEDFAAQLTPKLQ